MAQLTKKWTWVAYSHASGGKLICNLLQQSDHYDKWHTVDTKKLASFCKKTMPLNLREQLANEIRPPYKFDWYTREYPFTRGDNLTSTQVNELIKKHNNNIINKNIIMHYNKPNFPNWFKGSIIQIVTDNKSVDFLRDRRDAIFYRWKSKTVMQNCNWSLKSLNNKNSEAFFKKYSDTPEEFTTYHSKEEFYANTFYNNPEVTVYRKKIKDNRIVCYLKLSDIMLNHDKLLRQLQKDLHIKLDIKRCKIILKRWLEQNKRFF